MINCPRGKNIRRGEKKMNGIIPFRERSPILDVMGQFEREFEKFFKEPFFSMASPSNRTFPKINIREFDTKYVVEVATPGFKKEDIVAYFKDGCLHITSEDTKREVEVKNHYVHKEISNRSFHRIIPFSEEINNDKVEATYNNGILFITIKKKTSKKEKSKTIKIM